MDHTCSIAMGLPMQTEFAKKFRAKIQEPLTTNIKQSLTT